jgi:GNAT superfamily N-acetyltransferase
MTAARLPIAIRAATRADIATLTDYNAALAWETERKRLDRATLERGIAALFDDPRRGRYWIAERGGRVQGALLITYEWSDWRCGDWWWIQSVYVAAEARRHGVFRALYAAVEARARATAGVVGLRLYVERDNRVAQQTYAALGMQDAHYAVLEHAWGGSAG